MKTIYLNLAKCLGILLFLLASALTMSAYEQTEWVSINGLQYEITFDSDNPWEGSATLLMPSWDWETGEMCHIQYEGCDTDSILYLPAEVNCEYGSYPLTTILSLGGSSDLKTVYVPYTVTRIENGAFNNTSLESIYFLEDEYYGDSTPITFVDSNYGTQDGIFKGCNRLKRVEFNRPINQVVTYMFMSCPNLKYVYFNSDNTPLDSIGVCAFANCVGLTSISLPNSVKVIGKGAFANCHNLKTVNVPNSTATIGDYAFAECHQLNNINLNSSLQAIGAAAFLNCESLTSMSIPNNVSTIKDFTFYNCASLTSLQLNNVTTIGNRSFAGCNGLTSIDLSKAQSIGEGAFIGGHVYCSIWGTSYLTDSTNLSIATREEQYDPINGSLKKILLGEGISVINELTFSGHVPDTITCMAPMPPAYSRTDGRELTFCNQAYSTSILCVPQILVNDYREAYGWSRFAHIEGITILGNGDVNGDGQTTVNDVTILIDMLLGSNQPDKFNAINADTNGDGLISVVDVTNLIDKLLQGN